MSRRDAILEIFEARVTFLAATWNTKWNCNKHCTYNEILERELVLSHTNAVFTRFLRFPPSLNSCRLENPFDRQFNVNSINRVNRLEK